MVGQLVLVEVHLVEEEDGLPAAQFVHVDAQVGGRRRQAGQQRAAVVAGEGPVERVRHGGVAGFGVRPPRLGPCLRRRHLQKGDQVTDILAEEKNLGANDK